MAPLALSLLIAFSNSSCNGQGGAIQEDPAQQELRNQAELEVLVEKLRFLRTNDSKLGEKHPNKKWTQEQIRDLETALENIQEKKTLSKSPKSDMVQAESKLEDSLPQKILDRPDVKLIVQKIRFLRRNDSNFGEKHPNKRSTQLQIFEQESALKRIIEEEGLATPTSTSNPFRSGRLVNLEDTLPFGLRDLPDVQATIQKLLFLRIVATTFGVDHPNQLATQERIATQEALLLSLIKNVQEAPIRSAIELPATKTDVSLLRRLLQRKDVQILVYKLTLLRTNETNLGENNANGNSVQTDIRTLENSLEKIIGREQRAVSESVQSRDTSAP